MKLSEHEDSILCLAETLSLDKMRKKRKIMQYSDKVMNGRAGLTIESLDLITKLVPVAKGHMKSLSMDFLNMSDSSIIERNEKIYP